MDEELDKNAAGYHVRGISSGYPSVYQSKNLMRWMVPDTDL